MTDKRLSHSMKWLELLIQTVTFYSGFIAVYFGLKNPYSLFWKSVIIAFFVFAAYFARQKIEQFKPFMLVHIGIFAASLFIGKSEAESCAYVLITVVLVAYSIRLKTVSLQKRDLSNTPISDYSDDMDIAEQLELKKNLLAGEQVPMPFCAFMIVGYMMGHFVNSDFVMNTEVVLFVFFVLMQVVYRDLKKLNMVFITNKGKQQFPAQQLKRVNSMIIFATVMLMLFAMLLFYKGEYGNIFQVMGSGGMILLKVVLQGILKIWGSFNWGSMTTGMEEQTTEAESEFETEEVIETSPAASALFEALSVILLIAVTAGICYLIYRYIKNFNKKRKSQECNEEITTLKRETVKVKRNQQVLYKTKGTPETESIRKAYKKQVQKGAKDHHPNAFYTPYKLTKQYIVYDENKAEQITNMYEKARYANEPVSKEETKQFKEILKHGLTSEKQ